MNTAAKPMRTTLVFGLACGLLAFFLIGAARWTYFSNVLFQGLVWTCLAVYGILLARWSQTPLSRVVFPLALPLLLLLFHSPPQAFFLFSLRGAQLDAKRDLLSEHACGRLGDGDLRYASAGRPWSPFFPRAPLCPGAWESGCSS